MAHLVTLTQAEIANLITACKTSSMRSDAQWADGLDALADKLSSVTRNGLLFSKAADGVSQSAHEEATRIASITDYGRRQEAVLGLVLAVANAADVNGAHTFKNRED